MRRRQFLKVAGGALAAWPLAPWPAETRAQDAAMPVIGFLSTAEPRGYAHLVDGFRAGLAEAGFVEGRNVAIEFRFAEGKFDRLPRLAADLVARKVAVVVPFSDAATRAAIAATAKIPIVFYAGNDPVAQGFVASLNRPGGNTTGVSFFATNLGGKRLGLLRELLPSARTIVLIVNPGNPSSAAQIKDMQEAALTLGLTVTALNAGNEGEIELAFASDTLKGSHAVVIGADAVLNSMHRQFVALSQRAAIPSMSVQREFVAAGGLMSYGAIARDVARQTGIYAGRVLKGEKPADLPVLQASKFELVINLKTARTLGLNVPSGLMAIADEVVE